MSSKSPAKGPVPQWFFDLFHGAFDTWFWGSKLPQKVYQMAPFIGHCSSKTPTNSGPIYSENVVVQVPVLTAKFPAKHHPNGVHF
jgi:hypothetical protein